MEYKMKIVLSSVLAMVLSLAMVSAFGVSAPYWSTNPMIAYPGMDSNVKLNLQNIANPTGDVVAVMEIVKGADIISLQQTEYEVKQGSTVDVPLRVRIPDNAEIGSKYTVRVNLKTKTGGEGGMVGLATGMAVGFDVMVQEKPAVAEEANQTGWYLGIAIAVVLLIIIIVAIRRRNR